jgi:hypothetical protein
MFQQLLASSSALMVLLAGPLAAQAQTQQPAPQPQPQTAPQTQISPEELQKFAQAVKELQAIDRQAQTDMVKAVEAQGLTEKRFLEIYQSQQKPKASAPANLSSQEKQRFGQALTSVQGIQQQTQTKMQQALKTQGFEVQRFNQVMATVLKDPTLKQQVLQLLQS